MATPAERKAFQTEGRAEAKAPRGLEQQGRAQCVWNKVGEDSVWRCGPKWGRDLVTRTLYVVARDLELIMCARKTHKRFGAEE